MLNSFRRASIAAATLVFAAPASAQLSETVYITNALTTSFDPANIPAERYGSERETLYLGNYGSTDSELGLNYTAYANDRGFYFLHDNYCVGTCATYSSTEIEFTVSNDNETTANVRFDSQITPGHLAAIYQSQGTGSAGFTFRVLRVDPTYFRNGDSTLTDYYYPQTLYEAVGSVSAEGITLTTGNLTFNNLRRQTGANFDLLDWDTTNLSVDIGAIAPGDFTTIVYQVSYFSQTAADCADVFTCAGAQVVFGDPRNNGGTNLSFDGDANAETGRAVIGADYGATFIPYRFVTTGSPYSFDPPAPTTQLSYDPLYKSRLQDAVPEPASWALMIAGFGIAGSAMRRRRPLRPAPLSTI